MFRYGDHHGPYMKALFAEMKRRGLATDGMDAREFIGLAEKTAGVEALPTDGPEEAAAKWLTALGVPLPPTI